MRLTDRDDVDAPVLIEAFDRPGPGELAGSGESDRSGDSLASRQRRRRAALVVSVMCVYPLVFMRGILRPNSPYHLRSPYADPALLTDFDGGVRLSQIIEAMRWPWSLSPLSAWPTGEGILRWQTLSQGIQFGALYLLTRVVQPVFAMNLLVFVGWVLTGVATYGLARRLGAARSTALAAGLVAQMLPSIPSMAANYTSYVYICVPVYVLSRTLDMATAPSRRNFAWLVGALSISLFFDPYWFFFGLVIVLVGFLCNRRVLMEWYKGSARALRLVVVTLAGAPLALVASVVVLDRLVAGESSSRPLGIAHPMLIDAGLRAPWHWFRSSTEGVGLVIGFLGLASVGIALWRRSGRARTTAAVITMVLVILSTRTRIETPWFAIGSLAEYARFGLPGVRFFQRAALIGEVMLCVGAVLVVQHAVRRMPSTTWRVVALVALPLVAIADLAPLSHRAYQRRWDDFGAFREVIAEAPQPVVAALPFERAGRSWFELGLLGPVRSINPLFASDRAAATAAAASRGPGSLAAYLDSLGVTHVMAIEGADGFPITYPLEPPRFVLRGTLELNNYEFDPQTVGLFEVHPQAGDVHCVDCAIGGGYELIEGVDTAGEIGTLETQADTGLAWWWSEGAEVEITPALVDLGVQYDTVLEFTFGNAPCGLPRTISVTSGGITKTVEMRGSDTPVVPVEVTWAMEMEPVTIRIDGELCRIAGDPRVFGVQIFWPKVPPSR